METLMRVRLSKLLQFLLSRLRDLRVSGQINGLLQIKNGQISLSIPCISRASRIVESGVVRVEFNSLSKVGNRGIEITFVEKDSAPVTVSVNEPRI